jgi:UDP-glucose 4-epimerase
MIAGKRNSVLVTGGAGFIGSHLVESLVRDGAAVTVLDSFRDGKATNLEAVRDGITVVEGDVRSAAVVDRVIAACRPEVVYHLAANASVPASVADPAHDYETNACGTFVLLDALRRVGGCERFVLASSGAVYGQPERFPIRESDPPEPISPYGASKLSAEVTGRMFRRVYGAPVVIARLFNAYGPRMARFVVLDFLRKLQADPNNLEILGNGEQVRDFTYVADTVAGLRILAERGEPGEAYNLSSGTSCSVTDLAGCLLATLGLAGRTRLSYTGASWTGDAQRWEVSIERLEALGYRPGWPLADGLRRTAHWFQTTFRGPAGSAGHWPGCPSVSQCPPSESVA